MKTAYPERVMDVLMKELPSLVYPVPTNRDAWILATEKIRHALRSCYRRGQVDMRERAAQACAVDSIEQRIRRLLIEGDE